MTKTPKKRNLQTFEFSNKTSRQLAIVKRNGCSKKAFAETAIDRLFRSSKGGRL